MFKWSYEADTLPHIFFPMTYSLLIIDLYGILFFMISYFLLFIQLMYGIFSYSVFRLNTCSYNFRRRDFFLLLLKK